MNMPPIDRQQITLPSAGMILLLTFGLGAGWTTQEGRIVALEEARKKDREHYDKQNERTERLLNKICGKLQCDKEGMRE